MLTDERVQCWEKLLTDGFEKNHSDVACLKQVSDNTIREVTGIQSKLRTMDQKDQLLEQKTVELFEEQVVDLIVAMRAVAVCAMVEVLLGTLVGVVEAGVGPWVPFPAAPKAWPPVICLDMTVSTRYGQHPNAVKNGMAKNVAVQCGIHNYKGKILSHACSGTNWRRPSWNDRRN